VVALTTPVVQAPIAVRSHVQEESLGDAARDNKQHNDCLKLAASNPSITCK
jgi:hypothetical protein